MLTQSRSRAFHELVELQAALTPAAPAVISPLESLNYAELAERSNRLAHCLIEAGVGPESLVGLCVERSVHMITGMLGILKAGAAYVPLDPAYPSDRLAYMVEDSAARFIVSQRTLINAIPNTTAQRILVDDFEAERYPAYAPEIVSQPHHLAYVIYTSGSTGRPKGVMIEQQSMAAFAEWTRRRFSKDRTRRVLASSSLSFDVSVLETTAALSSGGALVIVRNVLDLMMAPPAEPISMIVSVPSPVAELVRARAIPPSVNTIVVGGEILTQTLANEIYATTGVQELINAWGVTEDTVVTTAYSVPRNSSTDPSIGEPIDGRRIHLLDEHLHPVAKGVPGELCCSGNGVARGYLNREDLSRERFVENPFGDSALLYRSGDLAVERENGEIRFIGRTDQQVKIRGYRIELGEIETALAEHPLIAQVAVLAKTIAGNMNLAMYAVERQAGLLTLPEVERYLSDKLPKHMIPSTLTVLDAMPLGPTGKTDRKELQNLVRERPALPQPYVAPRNATEAKVAELFAALLGLADIGIHDNFFALGGQSLLAARAIAEITNLYPDEITELESRQGPRALLTAFWQQPTIECIAAALLNNPLQHIDASPVEDIRCLQTGKAGTTPIFFLHGVIDGEAFYTWNLANALGPDQPLYTLAPHGRDGRLVPRTIEMMAADYLAKIKRIAPHGPYRFAGYCNGGLVCFEMARMLAAQGETVEKLVLIGTPGHNVRYRAIERVVRAIPGLRESARRHLYLRIRGRAVYFSHLFDRERKARRKLITGGLPLERSMQRDKAMQIRSKAIILAIDTYVPKYYEGSVSLLFGAGDIYAQEYKPFRDWAKVVSDLRTFEVPGDHHFVEEHPEVLLQHLG